VQTPWITRSLIAADLGVFLFQFASGKWGEVLVAVFGFIPARFFDPSRFGYSSFEVALTLITSLFLHGGAIHIVGNMLYLWIFGPTVEERMGPLSYAIFYLMCGAAGSLTHAFLIPTSTIPSIGASGSIAGVLGAFLLSRPKARIITLFPLVVSWAIAEIPAVVFLPVWFAMQFLNGFLALASAKGSQEVAGVAWWAHVGGFSTGVILAVAMHRLGHRVDTDEGRTGASES
jgi:membrane associated rhomboid family serine protease